MHKSLVFVCCSNKGRSVASEYLFRNMLQIKFEKLVPQVKVSSAGLVTKQDVEWLKSFGFTSWQPKPAFGRAPYPNLIPVMKNRGLDISKHRSKGLNRLLVEETDLLIFSEEKQKKMALSFWPWAAAKLFTFREFVEAEVKGEFLVSEDPSYIPHLADDAIDFTTQYHEAYVTEIENYLAQKFDKFLKYLQLSSESN